MIKNKRDKTNLTWEIAELFPEQGHWSEGEYFLLPSNHLIELNNGRLEVLAMPAQSHQILVAYLYQLLLAFVTRTHLGTVLFAPLRIQIAPGKYREPDIVFMLAENDHRRGERYWQGADLVMEVVSPDDPERDWVLKRQEYAQAGIPEYWVIDPTDERIAIFTLTGESYTIHSDQNVGQASSRLLEGFHVDLTAVFASIHPL